MKIRDLLNEEPTSIEVTTQVSTQPVTTEGSTQPTVTKKKRKKSKYPEGDDTNDSSSDGRSIKHEKTGKLDTFPDIDALHTVFELPPPIDPFCSTPFTQTIKPHQLTIAGNALLTAFLIRNTSSSFYFFERDVIFNVDGVSFVLSHSLLARKCSSSIEGYHYEIIDHNLELGSGSNGKVLSIIGTLNIENNQLVFDDSKPKAVKIQIHRQNKNSLEHLKMEVFFSPIHLHMKQPILLLIDDIQKIYQSYTVMHKFNGPDLYGALYDNDDYPAYELMCIAMNIADALSQQVQGNCIVHRDIKLENLMIENLKISVIDYGHAKSITAKEAQICGTEGYIPPEVRSGFPSGYPHDIFSLGIVLCLLFGAYMSKLEKVVDAEGKNIKVDSATLLFDEITYLTEDELFALDAFLKKVRHPNATMRPSLEKIYEFFNRMRCDMKLKNVHHEQTRLDIKGAHDEAIICKNTLNLLAMTFISTQDDDSVTNLKTTLLLGLKNVKDTPAAVKEFVEAINLRSRFTDKSTLITFITTTCDDYLLNIRLIQVLLKKVTNFNCEFDLGLQRRKDNLILKLSAILNKQSKYKVTLDTLAELDAKLNKKLKNLVLESDNLDSIIKDFTKPSQILPFFTKQHPLMIFDSPVENKNPVPSKPKYEGDVTYRPNQSKATNPKKRS